MRKMNDTQWSDREGSGVLQQDLQQNPTWKKLRNMHMAVSIIDEPYPLSISTRGIGFMLSKIMPQLENSYAYDSDDDELVLYEQEVPIAAMYRASLAQLEIKMYFARENQSWPFSSPSAGGPPLFSLPETSSCCLHLSFDSYNKNVSPVALMINSVGHVEVNKKHFEPRFLAERSPLNIRIINLREYCVEMSNLETESSKRVAGYQLNSIPNAKWEFDNADDPQSVYLTNPDEIISADYNDYSMQADFNQLHMFVSDICSMHMFEKFRGEIGYKRHGDPGILTSTHVVPGESMRINNNKIYSKDSEIYVWSRERIEKLSWNIGAVTLAGEILDRNIVSQRSQSLAAQTNYVNWRSVANSLIE